MSFVSLVVLVVCFGSGLSGLGRRHVKGDFVGKHIGEFAGIPATGKDVRVPLCVVYDRVMPTEYAVEIV
jgi:hypothetical protein